MSTLICSNDIMMVEMLNWSILLVLLRPLVICTIICSPFCSLWAFNNRLLYSRICIVHIEGLGVVRYWLTHLYKCFQLKLYVQIRIYYLPYLFPRILVICLVFLKDRKQWIRTVSEGCIPIWCFELNTNQGSASVIRVLKLCTYLNKSSTLIWRNHYKKEGP